MKIFRCSFEVKGEAIPPEQKGEGTMQQDHKLSDEIEQFLQSFNGQEDAEPERKVGEGEEIEEIDVYFVRRPKKEEVERREDEESPPRQRPRRNIPFAALIALAVNLFLALSVVVFVIIPQLTEIVTVTIVSKSTELTLKSTLQLGRVLTPITLSESQTVPTTGHGHQAARAAVGTLTIYNGSNTVQSINAGTVFTGNNGIQVVTSEKVTIPAAVPPQFGEATVTTQALEPGAQGNTAADDINIALSSDLTVKNLTSFTGGQDSRDYMVVTKTDRDVAAATLKVKVSSSMVAALQGQLTQGEQLQPTPCNSSVTAEHSPGSEATQVKITVSQTCSAVAYNNDTLLQRATALLSQQALKQLGTGYSLFGDIQVTVTQATPQINRPVVLSFTCVGTWVYALSQTAQQHIKSAIAGKTKQQALQLLLSLPGVQSVTIAGIGDTKKLPDLTRIHLFIIIEG